VLVPVETAVDEPLAVHDEVLVDDPTPLSRGALLAVAVEGIVTTSAARVVAAGDPTTGRMIEVAEEPSSS
jgi:hypothetical protein